MALHRHRRLKAPGLPEFVVVLCLIAVCIPAFCWYENGIRADWLRTGGHVISCDIRETHYNAATVRPKVRLSYLYDADGVPYTGTWVGYWPEAKEESPNALPPDKLNYLRTPDYPLVIYYDPDDPSQSTIHRAEATDVTLYKWTFAGLFVAALYYVLRVYPAWRRVSRF